MTICSAARRSTGLRSRSTGSVRGARGALRRSGATRRCCSQPSARWPRRWMRSERARRRSRPPMRLCARHSRHLRERRSRDASRGRTPSSSSRVSASWLASAEMRAADSGTHLGSSRLAAGNDALAKALAAELGDRVRLGCAVDDLRNVEDGVVLVRLRRPRGRTSASCSPCRSPSRCTGCCRPCASAAATSDCSGESPRSCTSRSPSRRRPPPSRDWRRRSGRGRRELRTAGRRRSPPRSPAASARPRASAIIGRRVALARRAGAPSPRARASATAPCSRAGGTMRTATAPTPATPRAGRAATTRRSPQPYGRIHLAGEHTAAEFCGTMEGALRSGSRAAREVLAARADRARAGIDQCRICDLDWWLADGSREARSTVQPLAARRRTSQRNRKPAPRSSGGVDQARHHPRRRRRAGPARRL